jgi:hypothetical protein
VEVVGGVGVSAWYNGKYDPANFNVPPEQKGGHSQKIQANIQSGHARAIDEVIRSGVFPFGKDTDFVRWAIREALLKIDAMEPSLISSVIKRANMMTRRLQLNIEKSKFEEWLHELQDDIRRCIGAGDQDMAKQTIAYCHEQILAMPDEPEREFLWKQKYMEALERNFPDLLPLALKEAA